MKRIILIVLSAVVLSLVPAAQACAQWENQCDYMEGLAAVKDSNGKWGFVNKKGKLVIPCKWYSVGFV